MSLDFRVRLATGRDVPQLAALESRYYIDNLDPGDRANGFMSVLHPLEWFADMVAIGGIHVAVDEDEDVVGFMVVAPPPDRAETGLPEVVRKLLDLCATLEINGTPIAAQRFALRGPVCIAQEARGRGVYSAFNRAANDTYRDRYDVGVLFVSAGNPRSLHTTTAKLGAQPLAVFEAGGRTFHLLAFEFTTGAPFAAGDPSLPR